LLDVIGIVTGHVNRQIRNRDSASLRMNPKAVPLLRRQAIQKLQVRITK